MGTFYIIIIFTIFILISLNKDVFRAPEKIYINDSEIPPYCNRLCHSPEFHIINSIEFKYFVCGCDNETFWFDSKTRERIDKQHVIKRIQNSEKIPTIISDYNTKCRYLCENDCESENQNFLNNSVHNISNTIFCDCMCDNFSSYPLVSENY